MNELLIRYGIPWRYVLGSLKVVHAMGEELAPNITLITISVYLFNQSNYYKNILRNLLISIMFSNLSSSSHFQHDLRVTKMP